MAQIYDKGSGLLIGKFMPPHRGHQYVVEFARNYVDRLTVLVCSLKSEPIPGELRYKWMREIFPDVNVLLITDENPQEPSDHPDFWNIWRNTIQRALPGSANFLFASEKYGKKLAEILGMKYIPVDIKRATFPVSGTAIRNNPIDNWEFIPEAVRPYYVKRVCIFGPESTGKSTMAKDLAKHFQTTYVSEFARGLLDLKDGKCDYDDIPLIARGQAASEDALARHANRVLFCDTDLLTTHIWSKILFGKCPEWITNAADERQYDLYLLMDTDVPFVADSQRYLPNDRQLSLERCVEELEMRGRNYRIIRGSWDERLKTAIKEVEEIIRK